MQFFCYRKQQYTFDYFPTKLNHNSRTHSHNSAFEGVRGLLLKKNSDTSQCRCFSIMRIFIMCLKIFEKTNERLLYLGLYLFRSI